MNIGTISLPKTAALAPMAGVGDRAFREICVEWGAAYVIGEMCSAKGLTYGSAKSEELLYISPLEGTAAIQLFGDEPETMGKAVELTLPYHPQIIDINMGCPAPKIAGAGSGSALMKTPKLASEIIKEAVKHSPVPVTVKFRKGWDNDSINAVEFAKMAEDAGASALAIHGRTRAQMYSPPVDLEIIAAVKEAVSIPVIGNGGITTAEEAEEMYNKTNCDLVMVGQGALGRPWIFQQITAYLQDGTILPDPPLEVKMQTLRKQVVKAIEYKGEKIALREARTHAAHYMHGLTGAASFRRESGHLTTIDDLDRLIELVIKRVTTENSCS